MNIALTILYVGLLAWSWWKQLAQRHLHRGVPSRTASWSHKTHYTSGVLSLSMITASAALFLLVRILPVFNAQAEVSLAFLLLGFLGAALSVGALVFAAYSGRKHRYPNLIVSAFGLFGWAVFFLSLPQ